MGRKVKKIKIDGSSFTFLPFYLLTFNNYLYLCALKEKAENASASLKMASTAILP